MQPHGTRLFVQLLHGGREQIAGPPRAPALAPSRDPEPALPRRAAGAAGPEIEEIVAGFGARGGLAAEAGLDGVEISAAHRYLIAQFLDPELNRRDDEWAEPDAVSCRGRPRGAARRRRRSASACASRRTPQPARRMAPLLARTRSTTLRSRSATRPPTSARRGSCRRRPCPTSAIVAAHRAVSGRAAADRDLAGRRRRRGRPLIAARARRRARHDAGADHRSRAAAQGPSRADARRSPAASAATPVSPTTTRTTRSAARSTRGPAGSARWRVPGRARRAAHVLVVVGAGPAGLPRRPPRRSLPVTRSSLLDRAERAAASSRSRRRPRGARRSPRLPGNHAGTLAARRAPPRHRGDAEHVIPLEPDAVVVATGARPFAPDLPLDGRSPPGLGRARRRLPPATRVVVADWGGDPAGLDAAEVLAAAGNEVTLAVASVTVGESVHQYRRNLYLQRLYRAGVSDPPPPRARIGEQRRRRLRNVFAPELVSRGRRRHLVLALGRVPGLARAGAEGLRSRRRETASRRARSRRRCSRARSRPTGSCDRVAASR